jgi:hypothetical protein
MESFFIIFKKLKNKEISERRKMMPQLQGVANYCQTKTIL